MRYTAILMPADEVGYTVVLPALPGCLSEGATRHQALSNLLDAAAGWLEVEAEQGRAPENETPELLASAVTEALTLLNDMVEAGELPADYRYTLELVPVEIPALAPVH